MNKNKCFQNIMYEQARHVAHTCYPCYLGGWDWENHSSMPTQAGSSGNSTSTKGTMAHTSSYAEAERRRITILGQPGQKKKKGLWDFISMKKESWAWLHAPVISPTMWSVNLDNRGLGWRVQKWDSIHLITRAKGLEVWIKQTELLL
jgi:hypothetical protein